MSAEPQPQGKKRKPSGMYGGVSADRRREERRGKLLDAGLELIATAGWSHTSIRRVCQRAGLSSRFFYESFESLDELAVALIDGIAADVLGAVVPALEGAEPLDVRVSDSVALLFNLLADDPRKARVAFVEALGSEQVMRRRFAIMRSTADLLAAECQRTYPELQDSEFVQLGALGLVGLIVELLIAWAGGEIERPREQLAADVTDLVQSTITGMVARAIERQEVR